MNSIHSKIIHTKRLIIRQFNSEDALALFELLSDEAVNTFLPWYLVKNFEETEQFLKERFFNSYEKGFDYRYAICLREDNKPIGYIWLANDESNDFGYALKKEFWHRGIVTEASKAVVDIIKKAGYPYITATHDVKNPHSGEVMKKLGMTYKYSYVEQWKPKNIEVTFRMYQLNFDKNKEITYLKYCKQYENHFIEEKYNN